MVKGKEYTGMLLQPKMSSKFTMGGLISYLSVTLTTTWIASQVLNLVSRTEICM
jgi:hypothetical protein